MKKKIGVVLSVMLAVSITACGGNTSDAGNVSGITDGNDGNVEVSEKILEMLGMSAEEFAAMTPEKQQAILNEMGIVLEEQGKEEGQQEQQSSKTYTSDDVMAGGSYVVVLGDYMNSITLYYEDGVLVKIVEEFQKNSEEEAETSTYEGSAVADYTFNFIDWDGVPLQDILDGMKDYGGFGQYKISKVK